MMTSNSQWREVHTDWCAFLSGLQPFIQTPASRSVRFLAAVRAPRREKNWTRSARVCTQSACKERESESPHGMRVSKSVPTLRRVGKIRHSFALCKSAPGFVRATREKEAGTFWPPCRREDKRV
jgi:hypothetical protein